MRRAAVDHLRGATGANSTADRAIDVLMLFVDQPILTTQDICDRLQMPRSTLYRYITSLKSNGLLVEDSRGAWRIGPQIFPLARAARAANSLTTIATAVIEDLARCFGETVSLYERAGHESVLLARIEATHRIRVVSSPGQILPWPGAASAKVLLAFAPDVEQAELIAMMTPIAYTKHTIVSERALLRTLRKIVKDGYAVSNQERHEGVIGIAAPVSSGAACNHCITLSAPSFRVTEDIIPSIIEAVKKAAQDLSQRLRSQDI